MSQSYKQMSSSCRKESAELGIRGSLEAWVQYSMGSKVSSFLPTLCIMGQLEYDWLRILIAIVVYVGCLCDPVISVRILRLLHNNSVDLQLIALLL